MKTCPSLSENHWSCTESKDDVILFFTFLSVANADNVRVKFPISIVWRHRLSRQSFTQLHCNLPESIQTFYPTLMHVNLIHHMSLETNYCLYHSRMLFRSLFIKSDLRHIRANVNMFYVNTSQTLL